MRYFDLDKKKRLLRLLEAEVMYNTDLRLGELTHICERIAVLRVLIAHDEQQEQEYNKQRKGHRFVMR